MSKSPYAQILSFAQVLLLEGQLKCLTVQCEFSNLSWTVRHLPEAPQLQRICFWAFKDDSHTSRNSSILNSTWTTWYSADSWIKSVTIFRWKTDLKILELTGKAALNIILGVRDLNRCLAAEVQRDLGLSHLLVLLAITSNIFTISTLQNLLCWWRNSLETSDRQRVKCELWNLVKNCLLWTGRVWTRRSPFWTLHVFAGITLRTSNNICKYLQNLKTYSHFTFIQSNLWLLLCRSTQTQHLQEKLSTLVIGLFSNF